MATMLSRPLTDNRMLRAVGGIDLRTTRGQAIGTVFETPTLTDLLTRREPLISGTLTEDQTAEFRAAEDARRLQIQNIEGQFVGMDDAEARAAQADALQRIYDDRAEQLAEYQRLNVEAGRIKSVRDLNEKYKPLGVEFSYPMSDADAEEVAADRRAQMMRDAIVQRSPGGIVQGAGMFGAGLISMATDPLELASNFIPVVSQSRMATFVARFGPVRGRVLAGAVEGAVGQAITEPLYYGLSRQAQLDYTMSDSLFNVGLGAVLGGSVGGVAGLLTRRAGGIEPPDTFPLDELPGFTTRPAVTKNQRTIAQTVVRQMVTDQQVNISPVVPSMADLEKEVSRLRSVVRSTKKSPVAYMVKSVGGIDPDGEIAAILKAQDITPKNSPGLFGKSGSKALDNIPATEQANMGETLWLELSGDNGYLDPQKIVDALVAERAEGSRQWQDAVSSVVELSDEIMRKEALWKRAFDAGMPLRNREELDFVDRYMMSGNSLEDAIERLAIMGDDNPNAARLLAENASFDPVANPVAAKEIEVSSRQDVDTLDEIAEYEAMLRDVELTEEQALELAAMDAAETRAAAYKETAQAAALCIARG